MSTSPSYGIGLYSRSDVARYVDVSSPTITRWLKGYKHATGESDPIVHTPVIESDDFISVTFLQFIEMWVVKSFLEVGLSLHQIRKASSELIEEYGIQYPFAYKGLLNRIRTDRKTIFVIESAFAALDLDGSKQYEFLQMIIPFIHKLRFNESDMVEKLWPLGKNEPVVLNPNIRFGDPICEHSCMPTYLVWQTWKSGQDYDSLSNWYSISKNEAIAACRFEESIRSKKQAAA